MTCIDIYKNINIVARRNVMEISPCCVSPTRPANSIDFLNNPYLVELRKEIKNNQFPMACNGCKNAEDLGLTSRRQGSNAWYKDKNLFNDTIELIRMDYWTGDTCNLACVICGPDNSSVWKRELGLPVELQKSTVNQFWKNIDLTKIKFIHFNGGEPLLSKEHVKFLHAIEHKAQVHLHYNTNGTILPSKELIDLWQHFSLVQLEFSIDDVGDRFEYQRYPAKWADVTAKLQWYIDNAPHNCMFAVSTSVGILNYSNLDQLNLWLQKNFYTTRFADPIEHRQQLTIGMFALKDADKRKSWIVSALDSIDQRRGTNWRVTLPELLRNSTFDHSITQHDGFTK
jgi:sulfatase maturation enzyme AslB (radical SAM superfamily)